MIDSSKPVSKEVEYGASFTARERVDGEARMALLCAVSAIGKTCSRVCMQGAGGGGES